VVRLAEQNEAYALQCGTEGLQVPEILIVRIDRPNPEYVLL
jgi:hypothetical protein